MRQDTLRLHRTDGSEELLLIPLKTTEGSAASVAQMAWGLRFCGQHSAPDSAAAGADFVKAAVDAILLRTGDAKSSRSGRGSSSIRLAMEEVDRHRSPAGSDCTVPLAQCDLQLALLQPAPSPVW